MDLLLLDRGWLVFGGSATAGKGVGGCITVKLLLVPPATASGAACYIQWCVHDVAANCSLLQPVVLPAAASGVCTMWHNIASQGLICTPTSLFLLTPPPSPPFPHPLPILPLPLHHQKTT